MERANPFALVRASEYTDEQINSLWVEIGAKVVEQIIEPRSRISKYILGGKGTGKTHLLRYHSYAVARLRKPDQGGVTILRQQKALAVFVRASGIDPLRFAVKPDVAWQQLFGAYLELRLGEAVLDALCDVKTTSPTESFDDRAMIAEIAGGITDHSILECESVEGLRDWVIGQRKRIDQAVNNVAFSGVVNIPLPFSVGAFCLRICPAMQRWCKSLEDIALVYLVDEIENFNAAQQQVLNSLIRYAEGRASFRVSGRLYSRKTFGTMADGEDNREGAEFVTVFLDEILRSYPNYKGFAERFIARRLASAGVTHKEGRRATEIRPRDLFEDIDSSDYYSGALRELGIDGSDASWAEFFVDALRASEGRIPLLAQQAVEVAGVLMANLPLMIQKLNLLLFCKRFKRTASPLTVASEIRVEADSYVGGDRNQRSSYAIAYGHYAGDLFAQLCRDSKKAIGVPYAGFDCLVKMSSGNPRNLLILLGRAYALASFRGIELAEGERLSIRLQTEAATEAARFFFEADSNFGGASEVARDSVTRLATVLRTARYALNVPEVSPLAVSFAEEELSQEARRNFQNALNYSLLFEIRDGRPDRNSERLNRKVQLNPLLSPRWGLPIHRRGDLSLGRDLAEAIFSPTAVQVFDHLLRELNAKWNRPFGRNDHEQRQAGLFSE